jgi:hypothetical protein
MEVRLDGPLGDRELLGDLAVPEPCRDHPDDFRLARREHRLHFCREIPPFRHPLHGARDERGIE